jgi:hypothetical protein
MKRSVIGMRVGAVSVMTVVVAAFGTAGMANAAALSAPPRAYGPCDLYGTMIGGVAAYATGPAGYVTGPAAAYGAKHRCEENGRNGVSADPINGSD